jgi:D-inositol-3-phosphate glycosyltransferase
MRVQLASANFDPHVGGIERFTAILARGLAAKGHEVRVVCCRYGDAAPFERVDGYEIERLPAAYTAETRLGVPYPLPLRRPAPWGAEVVHVQDVVYATSLYLLVRSRRQRIPSVLTQHVEFVPQANAALDLAQRAALGTIGHASRLATVVTSYNQAVADWATATWGLRDVRVLPVGVSDLADGDVADRAELGLPRDRFVALFVGRDVPKKGLDIFLQAADPAYELLALTDRPGVGPGFVEPARLQRLLHAVDAFVLPSEAEGFPLTLQEALRAGLPIVTTRQPGYEQYLGEDDALFVDRDPVSVAAALRRLVEDESLRARLAERSRRVGKANFGADRFVDAYESLYEELLGL